MVPFCGTFKYKESNLRKVRFVPPHCLNGRLLFNEHVALKNSAIMKKDCGISGVWMDGQRKAAPNGSNKITKK